MNKGLATREKLLTHARYQLWARGYSNVSLRQIAQAVGVDVALISRYFGGKLGLFEATLEGAFTPPPVANIQELTDAIVDVFANAPRDGSVPSIMQLLVMNANDPDVGEVVRKAQAENMQNALETIIGDQARAALLMSVLLGYSIGEKTLKLDGIPSHRTPEYEKQLRHLIAAALNFRTTP